MREYGFVLLAALAVCACGSDEEPPSSQAQSASAGAGAAGAAGGGGVGAGGVGATGGTAPSGPGCPEGDTPQVIAAAVDRLTSVVATDGYVAWLTDTFAPPGSGSLTRLRFGEAAPDVLVDGNEGGGTGLIGNATHLAWSTLGSGARLVPVDGGAPVVSIGSIPSGHALTDSHLYVASGGGIIGTGVVARVPLAGGMEEEVFDLAPNFAFHSGTSALSVGAAHAWALVNEYDGAAGPFDILVRGAPLDGSVATSTLVNLGAVQYAIAVADAAAVYVADHDHLTAYAIPGSGATPLADLGGFDTFDQPTRLTQDADSIYWVKAIAGTSRIMRAAKDGSGSEELVAGAGTWEDLSVTAGAYFWLRRVDGTEAADVVCLRR